MPRPKNSNELMLRMIFNDSKLERVGLAMIEFAERRGLDLDTRTRYGTGPRRLVFISMLGVHIAAMGTRLKVRRPHR